MQYLMHHNYCNPMLTNNDTKLQSLAHYITLIKLLVLQELHWITLYAHQNFLKLLIKIYDTTGEFIHNLLKNHIYCTFHHILHHNTLLLFIFPVSVFPPCFQFSLHLFYHIFINSFYTDSLYVSQHSTDYLINWLNNF